MNLWDIDSGIWKSRSSACVLFEEIAVTCKRYRTILISSSKYHTTNRLLFFTYF